jgi:signal transduction histidine kinase
MHPSNYHQQLANQIRETLGNTPDLPVSFQNLLNHISATYTQFDVAKKRLEANIELRTEQLVASTSRAYSFLDSLNMGLIMCDVNPEVVFTNTPVRSILASKKPEEVSSQPAPAKAAWSLAVIDQLMQPGVQLKDSIAKSLTSGQPLEYRDVDFGQRVLSLSVAPMINKDEKGSTQQIGVVVLVEDVTEQKVLERSRDEFFSIASHELRTPLTAIRGNSSLIKQYYGDKLPDNDVIEMIDDIHESSVRLIGIVNDFLDVSALEQGKILMNTETFMPNEILGSMVRELQSVSKEKATMLIVDPNAAAAPAVTADKKRIKQVMYNLIGNALKFTEKGSITISARADEHFVYIVVTDTGIGMSAESQRLLFRKFQQASSSLLTRDATKGTGLGLYISKLIIEQSGGAIGLERSEPGKGSSFVFSLPRGKTQTLTEATSPSKPAPLLV